MRSIFVYVIRVACLPYLDNPNIAVFQLNDVIKVEVAAPERNAIYDAEILIAFGIIIVASFLGNVILAPDLKVNLGECSVQLNMNIVAYNPRTDFLLIVFVLAISLCYL